MLFGLLVLAHISTISQDQHQSGPAPVLPAKTNVSNVSRAHITSGADNFQQHEDLQHCQ